MRLLNRKGILEFEQQQQQHSKHVMRIQGGTRGIVIIINLVRRLISMHGEHVETRGAPRLDLHVEQVHGQKYLAPTVAI